MNSKRVEGQITVFAALVFSVVVALIVVTIRSAAFSAGFLRADLVAYAGVNSEFSQYFRPLADNFHVFGLEIIKDMDKEMELYMQKSIEADNSLINVKLSGVTISNMVRMVDYGGLPIKEQIVSYMKYGVVSDVFNMLTGNEAYKKKCQVITELNDDIMKCAEMVADVNENLIIAAGLIDGLATADGVFSSFADVPVVTSGNFFKKAAVTQDPRLLGILDGRVYYASGVKCQNMKDILVNIARKLGDESALLAECTRLRNLTSGCRMAGSTAVNYCEKYKREKADAVNAINNYTNKLKGSKEIIGDEAYNAFLEEKDELMDCVNGKTKLIFDIETVCNAIGRNIQSLEVVEHLVKDIDKLDYDEQLSVVNEIAIVLANYSCADIVIDYSNIRFIKDNGILSTLRSLSKNIGKQIMDIVMQGREVSKEKVNLAGLAMKYASPDKNGAAAKVTSLTDKALMVEYVSSRFDSYGDYAWEDGGLKYDLEFLYAGANADSDNLKRVITDMVKLREVPNLVTLISDSTKRKEAYSLAYTVAGFTGNEGLVRAIQLIIMGAWAYSEAVMDIKRLINGEKIELIKAKKDWKMELSKVLAFDYTYFPTPNTRGLNYKEYLLLMLMTAKDSDFFYATMSAMEMRMIALGYDKFRMENMIYEINGLVEFIIRDQIYEKSFRYNY